METIFPELTGLAGFFLNSYRRTGGALEQTGTVVVKRTYDVNRATGELTPAETALPIFESDQTVEFPPGVTTIQYEHDLAAIKPQGDLVVWGFVGPAGIQRLRVNGATWLSRNIAAPAGEAALFGWQPRNRDPRDAQGSFPPNEEGAYPMEEALPPAFDNLYYNGYLRMPTVIAAAPFRYLLPGDVVRVERNGSVAYELKLGPETATATYYVYSGSGPDVEARWQPHTLVMQRDTVVITPDEDTCYVVWRAVWPFASHPADAYRRLEVVFDENG